MSDAMDILLANSNEKKEVTGELLQWLQSQVGRLKYLQEAKERLEKSTQTITNEINQLLESDLPKFFQDHDIKFLQVGDVSVEIKKFYQAKIPEDRQGEAFKWLEDHNSDSIIKSEIKMTFGKGEAEKAKEERAKELLMKARILFDEKRGVHPQTLKSFVKNAIEEGEQIPLDLFGVYIGHRATIK